MSKKAIAARRWRVTATGERRFNKLLNAYVQTLHEDIYRQVKIMYDNLNEKYPEKNDLTKTTEFKTWKMTNSEIWKTWERKTQTDEEQTTATTADEEQTAEEQATATTADEEQTDEEQTTTADEEQTDEEQTTAAVEEQTMTVDEEQTATTDQEQADEERATASDEEQVGENDMEGIIGEIIRDLQEDEHLRDMLDNDFAQPLYAYEDEGIGLNVELELEDIIEPLDLEEEGFFF